MISLYWLWMILKSSSFSSLYNLASLIRQQKVWVQPEWIVKEWMLDSCVNLSWQRKKKLNFLSPFRCHFNFAILWHNLSQEMFFFSVCIWKYILYNLKKLTAELIMPLQLFGYMYFIFISNFTKKNSDLHNILPWLWYTTSLALSDRKGVQFTSSFPHALTAFCYLYTLLLLFNVFWCAQFGYQHRVRGKFPPLFKQLLYQQFFSPLNLL